MKNLKAAFAALVFINIFVGCSVHGGRSVGQNDEKWNHLKLWYNKPAQKWTEALPVGNGRLGAMVYGTVQTERLQLNEDTLWSGQPVERDRVGAYKHLPEARRLIFEGKYAEAQSIMQREFMGPRLIRSYQTLGDLRLRFGDIPPLQPSRTGSARPLSLARFFQAPSISASSFASRAISRDKSPSTRAFGGRRISPSKPFGRIASCSKDRPQ